MDAVQVMRQRAQEAGNLWRLDAAANRDDARFDRHHSAY